MIQQENATLVSWPKGINIAEILREFDSPAWIVNESQLCSNISAFAKFTGDTGRIYYPVKTNPSLSVLRILANAGVGADCSSISEIDMALYAGIRIENISYNTPAQDVKICRTLLLSGGTVVMDDIDAIEELQSAIENEAISGKLVLRINLPESAGYLDYNENQELMAHGHASSKFGIPSEELDALLPRINLPISGLHVHVGTQMDNIENFKFAIDQLNKLAEKLTAQGHPITDINIGGGLGIPFSKDHVFPSLEYWCDFMMGFKHDRYNYCVEPGHALVGNAVALLTKILAVKNSRGKKWAIVDVGTDQLTKVTLLKWPHRILDASGAELPAGKDAVAGPLCFAGDTLLNDVSVDGLGKDSPLLITEAGAYTYSLANKFNGRLAPKWILMNAKGEYVLTKDSETRYDNFQYASYDWHAGSVLEDRKVIDAPTIGNLSSQYLKSDSSEDSFSYEKVFRTGSDTYEFTVSTSSKVDFISMPFAIRIFGDAAIIALLHADNRSKKDMSVWGRKLMMDCFNKVKSNDTLTFSISFSKPNTLGGKKVYSVRFSTACKNCVGTIIVSYGN
jgi:diaminopimelate decarboxylase